MKHTIVSRILIFSLNSNKHPHGMLLPTLDLKIYTISQGKQKNPVESWDFRIIN